MTNLPLIISQGEAVPNLLPIPGEGEAYHIPKFYTHQHSLLLLNKVYHETTWDQGKYRKHEKAGPDGQPLALRPRWHCWFAEDGSPYRYHGMTLKAFPFTDTIRQIALDLSPLAGRPLDSALCNFYRSGADGIGYHNDSEKIFGVDPVLVGLSLGSDRNLRFKHIATGEKVTITLRNGDVYVMRGPTQTFWKHAIEKEPFVKGQRISLSFRQIVPLPVKAKSK